MTGRLALLSSAAAVSVAWLLALEFWPPGSQRDCALGSCALLIWFSVFPVTIFPMILGALFRPPVSRGTLIAGGCATAGAFGLTASILAVITAPAGESDVSFAIFTWLGLFGLMGSLLAGLFVAAGAQLRSWASRRDRE